MANIKRAKLPSNAPGETTLKQDKFNLGVITLINESRLPNNALKEAKNCFLYEDGSPGPRWGINWYGSALPDGGRILGASGYQAASGNIHMVAVSSTGTVWRSLTDAGVWVACTGGTLDTLADVNFEQASQSSSGSNLMYITNGVNNIYRYDGTTVLQSYTTIAAPTSLTAAATTGIQGTSFTYYYRIAAVNNVGFSEGSNTATIGTNTQRPAFDPTNNGNNKVTLNWAAVTGAVRYDIYITDNAGDNAANNLLYLASVGSNSFIDNGQATPIATTTVPTQNTSTGPKVAELTYVGSRLFGTRDPQNKYRVWWTGSGPFIGYFSDSYDGGYIDLQKGSQFKPVKVVDYRDGKGTPLATIWCDSADGKGCVWQLSLESQTTADSTFTVPNAYKLPGSRGTNAPKSVVNVLNDFYFFNYQAMYNLGSRAQFLNLLSTDEISSNIRTTWVENINPTATPSICADYYQARVFVSTPKNGTVNNSIDVYDTERKAWILDAYDGVGAKKFFQYTDTSGYRHLLFWKPGDSQLSETSSSIAGDYGKPFTVSLTTGLISVDKDRFAWMWINEMEIELANPGGGINMTLYGIDRNKGYTPLKTGYIPARVQNLNVGWSSFAWSSRSWSNTSVVPQIFAESSLKRYKSVQREAGAYQINITAKDVNARFVLRLLQIKGTPTESRSPRQYRMN